MTCCACFRGDDMTRESGRYLDRGRLVGNQMRKASEATPHTFEALMHLIDAARAWELAAHRRRVRLLTSGADETAPWVILRPARAAPARRGHPRRRGRCGRRRYPAHRSGIPRA